MLTIGTLHLPSVALSVSFWTSFYFLLRGLQPARKAEWHCRLVTVCHASFITLLTAWASFVQGPWPFTHAGGPSTPLQVTAVTICVGYFLFDFAWCLYFQTEGFTMLLHHSLSIFGFFFMLCAGKYGSEMVATIGGSELTNPLLQLRWFLRETGRYHTWTGEIVDIVFMTSFFLLRIVVGSAFLYSYFLQPTDFWGRLAAVCIYLIGWLFWVSIFQYACYKYGKKYRAWRRSRKTGVESSPVGGEAEQNGCREKQGDNSQDVGCGATVVSPGVSKNGVHLRNNGMHEHLGDTSTRNGRVGGGGGGVDGGDLAPLSHGNKISL